MKLLAIRLSPQAGKSLVIFCGGYWNNNPQNARAATLHGKLWEADGEGSMGWKLRIRLTKKQVSQ